MKRCHEVCASNITTFLLALMIRTRSQTVRTAASQLFVSAIGYVSGVGKSRMCFRGGTYTWRRSHTWSHLVVRKDELYSFCVRRYRNTRKILLVACCCFWLFQRDEEKCMVVVTCFGALFWNDIRMLAASSLQVFLVSSSIKKKITTIKGRYVFSAMW
jgi:hypothetical protein